MKVLVDKLPKTKEECLFCIEDRGGFHRCSFKLGAYDFHGLTTTYRDCFLTQNLECPYLKEDNKNETLD